MIQLLIIISQYLLGGIAETVDTAFGNNISIDAICVLSALSVIYGVTWVTRKMGNYAYIVMQENPKSCLLVNVIISFFIGIIIIHFADNISHFYSLTTIQYEIFTNCLIIHGISQTFMGFADFFNDYVILKKKNKCMVIGNIIYYVFLILGDAIVFTYCKSLENLIWATLVSYIVFDIFILFASGILKEKEKYSIDKFKEILKHGFNSVFDKIAGKIATIFFNIYASKLGTELFAIHGVCYSIAVFNENYAFSLGYSQLIELTPIKNIKNRWNKCKDMIKSRGTFVFILSYFSSIIFIFIMHGEVPIKSAFPFLLCYNIEIIAIILYESFKSFLSTEKKTNLMKWAGCIGILVRIPVVLLFYHLNFGLTGFAFVVFIDFICRSLYLYLCCKKTLKSN